MAIPQGLRRVREVEKEQPVLAGEEDGQGRNLITRSSHLSETDATRLWEKSIGI